MSSATPNRTVPSHSDEAAVDLSERLRAVFPGLERSGDFDLLRSRLTLHRFDKGAALLMPGSVCRVEGIVAAGCLRVYRTDAEGMHRVLYFAPAGWYASDVVSVVTERPATLGIDALEPTEVWVMSRDAPSTEDPSRRASDRLRQAMREGLLLSLQTRLAGAMAATAFERYVEFLGLYPGLESRIAQYHVAAYLGVSPEFLSRMRRRLRPSPKGPATVLDLRQ